MLFLPYQRRWIEDRSRLKIMEKSRQIGLSWATAYASLRRLRPHGQEREVWVSSRDEAQARLFLEDCRHFAELLDLGAVRLYGTPLLGGATQHTLQVAGGGRIHSLSSAPDAQAGKSGTRILDEFALHPDPRRLFAVAYPGITWGGSLELISTHRGRHHYFNTLLEEVRQGNPKGFSHHRVTLVDALDDGFLECLQKRLPQEDPRREMDRGDYFDFVRAGCPDEATFRQEYLCEPLDDERAFLPWDVITSAESDEATLDPPAELIRDGDRTLFLGVDIGRERDLTVLWLLEKARDTFVTYGVRELRETTFADQEAELHQWMRLPGLRRAAIDATGIGHHFAENAARRYPARIAEVTFTPQAKDAMAYPLRRALEEGRLSLPAEPAIRADLHSVELEPHPAGPRLRARRTRTGHADRFWALALAHHAATEGASTFHYASTKRRKPATR
ncbi:MAG: terminase large subunit domain-containing protein [Opitutales bacterium]